mmetsp:Transcript_15899/g.40177  ORF Transcript_15899/g.40177 Transcript_15899/m.40177 type:complete len:320 (-) Transcript_15899:82-1041(-)
MRGCLSTSLRGSSNSPCASAILPNASTCHTTFVISKREQAKSLVPSTGVAPHRCICACCAARKYTYATVAPGSPHPNSSCICMLAHESCSASSNSASSLYPRRSTIALFRSTCEGYPVREVFVVAMVAGVHLSEPCADVARFLQLGARVHPLDLLGKAPLRDSHAHEREHRPLARAVLQLVELSNQHCLLAQEGEPRLRVVLRHASATAAQACGQPPVEHPAALVVWLGEQGIIHGLKLGSECFAAQIYPIAFLGLQALDLEVPGRVVAKIAVDQLLRESEVVVCCVASKSRHERAVLVAVEVALVRRQQPLAELQLPL